MHILFALVIWSYGYGGSAVASRIGAYEKLSQCEKQGQALLNTVGSQNAHFRCVPVNE